ncbi:MAG TPA: hypothetical protein VGR13_08030 [Actinomycetota bacterium]|nr:hypothetical protein [Actinomycetota bacterium]
MGLGIGFIRGIGVYQLVIREEVLMAVAYTSRVRIERLSGGTRKASLPVDSPVMFGVHDEIAEHYKKEPGTFEPHASTLDYVVAAAGG